LQPEIEIFPQLSLEVEEMTSNVMAEAAEEALIKMFTMQPAEWTAMNAEDRNIILAARDADKKRKATNVDNAVQQAITSPDGP
jgi:hypothetical protein